MLYKKKKYRVHRDYLAKEGISLKEADHRDYRFLDPSEMQAETGITSNAIAMPTASSDDKSLSHTRYRFLDESVIAAREAKYHQRSNSGVRIHFGRFRPKSKRNWRNGRKRRGNVYVITEGEKKSDGHNFRCLGVPGVTSYKGSDGKLHPDFHALNFDRATFEICYDDDQNIKPQVWKAAFGLQSALEEYARSKGQEIIVRYVTLYPVPGLKKTGLDDFIQHYGEKAFLEAPRHDSDSLYIQAWRERVGKLDGQLPAALQSPEPFPPQWLSDAPPAVEWIIPGLLQKNENATLIGSASVGKSTLLMMQMASVGGGVDLGFGTPTVRPCMYLMLERHPNSMHRRWYRLIEGLTTGKMKPAKAERFVKNIQQNCFLRPLAGESFDLIEYKHRQWVVREDFVDALIEQLKALGIEWLIIDPFSRLNGGDENDNSRAATLTKACERIMRGAGCSITLVHHTGKTDRGDMYAGRGASALTDNTSETYVMSQLDATEREKLRLPDKYKDWDLILFRHARTSDERLQPDAYLARDPDNGLLTRISVHRVSSSDRAAALTDETCFLCEWAQHLPEGEFTKRAFVTARDSVFGSSATISERDAAKIWSGLVEAKLILPATVDGKQKNRRGGALYKIKPDAVSTWQGGKSGSAARVPRSTAALRK